MIEQGTEEWHRARAGKITASRISDVMAKGRGNAPSATRAKYLGEIVASRMTGEPSRMSFRSASMDWGNETEDQARAVYTMETGLDVLEVGICLHPDDETFAASPDGLVGDDGGLEIKCPDTHTHIATLLAQKVPANYLKQIQWNMACTGRLWWDFMSFEPTMPEHLKSFICRVERDNDLIREMEEAATAFNADASETIEQLNALSEKPQ